MKTIARADVLVVGGGPSGIGAAIASARSGAETLLLERHAFFGGIASFCLGMPINQMRPSGNPRSAVHELLIARLTAYGDQAVIVGAHELQCNVEYLKVAVLDALEEVGCRYLVHAPVVEAIVTGSPASKTRRMFSSHRSQRWGGKPISLWVLPMYCSRGNPVASSAAGFA